MSRTRIKQLDPPPSDGLSLVGKLLQGIASQMSINGAPLPICAGVRNSDMLCAYLSLLIQGKGDFDAIESLRGYAFFTADPGIKRVPSSPTLRKLLAAPPESLFDYIPALHEAMLLRSVPDYGAFDCDYLLLDTDGALSAGKVGQCT